ncbi:MAG TPA: peptidoglycan DD-metalloendopeptidase family protein [Clostridiaceae bacterium]|nr:peptidoglycan DD-metalloendopeptidase family protein [Clostridiaceae bacterium]
MEAKLNRANNKKMCTYTKNICTYGRKIYANAEKISTYKLINEHSFLIMKTTLNKIREFFRNHKSKLKLIILVVILIPVLTLIALHTVNATKAYEVSMDGQYLCTVKTGDVIQEVLNEVKKRYEEIYNAEIVITNKIDYKEAFFASNKVNTYEEIKDKIEQSVTILAKAYEINVDGTPMGYLRDKSSAEEVLNRIKAPYIGEEDDVDTFSFLEQVEIIEKEIPVEQLQSVEEVYNNLSKPKEEIKVYIVKKGDTVSDIAEEYGLKVANIKKANPDLDVDRISIGQEIKLTVPRYTINVIKKEYVSYEEEIPYGKKYEDTDSLYKGQTQVKVEGVNGRKLVKTEVMSINGIVESTTVVSEEVLEEPKEAVILRGTKERPRTLAYGEFIVPSRGTISSRFGQRWSSTHTGIDIAASKGTPIKAADSGLVTFAGWKGSYGNLIIIDHENGYVTYYTHCNTINVKKGQRVARGDTIGTVGSTGNATGPHLHFEVRKNGVPVNPLDYLKW